VEFVAPLLLAIGLTATAWLVLVAVLWLHRPSRELARPVLLLIPDVARLVRALLGQPTTPRMVQVALGLLLAWLVSPIDLVPDFIPVLGSLDDVIVAAVILRWAARRVGRENLATLWTGTPEGWRLLERVL
jgi:uncharacterized membrane protein YkvA (DUF1232 family)